MGMIYGLGRGIVCFVVLELIISQPVLAAVRQKGDGETSASQQSLEKLKKVEEAVVKDLAPQDKECSDPRLNIPPIINQSKNISNEKQFEHIEAILDRDLPIYDSDPARLSERGRALLGREDTLIPASWDLSGYMQELQERRAKYIETGFSTEAVNERIKKVRKYQKQIQKKQDEILRKTNAFLQEAGVTTDEQRQKFIKECLEGNKSHVEAIVKAKKLWLDLLDQEGAFISLNSFGSDSPVGYLKEIQQLNSSEVDKKITEQILREHQQGREKAINNTGKNFDVFIQGGGPSGLYAAIRNFQEGADVTLVNDRDDNFSRSQIIRFDPKWQAALQYYLGDRYKQILDQELGTIRRETNDKTHIASEMLEIPLYVIEDALKKRADELADKLPDKLPKELSLQYKTTMVGVKHPTKNNHRYRVTVEDKDSGTRRDVETDMIELAGGSNNPLRDELISPAFARTEPLTHSVSVFNKLGKYNGPGKPPLLKTGDRFDGGFDGRLYMSDLAKELDQGSKKMDDWIRSELKKLGINSEEFENFNEKLVSAEQEVQESRKAVLREKKVQLDVRDDPARDDYRPSVTTRQFENSISVYLGYKVPKMIADLRKKVLEAKEADQDESSKERGNKYDKFISKLELRFHEAAVRALVDDPSAVERDTRPVANGFFDVTQTTGNHTATVHQSNVDEHLHDLVVAATGDAVASPHFMTWSGLNMSRHTAEEGARAIKKYFNELVKGDPKKRRQVLSQIFGRELQAKHNLSTHFLRYRAELLFLQGTPKEKQRTLAKTTQEKLLETLIQRSSGKKQPDPGEILIKKKKENPKGEESGARADQVYVARVGNDDGNYTDIEFILNRLKGDTLEDRPSNIGGFSFSPELLQKHPFPNHSFANVMDLVLAYQGAQKVELENGSHMMMMHRGAHDSVLRQDAPSSKDKKTKKKSKKEKKAKGEKLKPVIQLVPPEDIELVQ